MTVGSVPRSKTRVRVLKAFVWLVGLAPLGWGLFRLFLGDGFGVNPIAPSEIESWLRLSGIAATRFELQCLMEIEAALMEERAKAASNPKPRAA